jgi:predicted ATPase
MTGYIDTKKWQIQRKYLCYLTPCSRNCLIMENIEKYIFDPANPKQCKVYEYLVTLLATREMSAFIAPEYFVEIYKDHLLTPAEKAQLWDIPDNMGELSGTELFEVYKENFGLNDLLGKIGRKDFKDKKRFSKLFMQVFRSKNGLGYGEEMKVSPTMTDMVLFVKIDMFSKMERQISETYAKSFATITRTIFITTLADFENNEEKVSGLPYTPLQNGDLKPLLLRNITDFHILLDYLYKDVEQKKAQLKALSAPSAATQFGYLDQLAVQNYLTLSNIELSGLGNCKEIYFLGENGDGKTIILQAIALALAGDTQSVGLAEAIAQMRLQNPEMNLSATDNLGKQYAFGQVQLHPFLYGYGVNRFRNDSDKKAEYAHQTLFDDDCYLENPIKWLQYLDYAELKAQNTPIGKLQAIELLREILDHNEFSIDINPDAVIFYVQNQRLPFEHLSHGYKSVITWVADLLTRLAKQQPDAVSTHDFTGIVLIDEVDLFLHPKWQREVVRRLRRWFSGLQFIITTHSPIVVLGASPDALFYKIYRHQDQTQVSEAYTATDLDTQMANGIITSPLFDLDTAKMDMATEQTNVSTRDTYLHDRIFIAIDDEVKARKKAGINYVSQQEIKDMIQKALANQTKAK